jgi:DNA-binding MarR family transcriptional regulator
MDETGDRRDSEIDIQVEAFLAAWFKVRQQIQALNFNRAHQHGLSATQFMALALVEEAEGRAPATISFLASRLNLDPATVVRTVDSLENRALVERRRDTEDRRQVFVTLTEEGRSTQQSSHQRFKDSLAAIFRAMSPEGRAGLLQGFEEFASAGQQVEQTRDPSSG